MVQVLEHGKSWTTDLKCSGKGTGNTGCGAKLRIGKEDLFVIYGGGYTENIPYIGIECPECEITTCLEDADIKVPAQFNSRKLPDRPVWKNKNREICHEEGNRG